MASEDPKRPLQQWVTTGLQNVLRTPCPLYNPVALKGSDAPQTVHRLLQRPWFISNIRITIRSHHNRKKQNKTEFWMEGMVSGRSVFLRTATDINDLFNFISFDLISPPIHTISFIYIKRSGRQGWFLSLSVCAGHRSIRIWCGVFGGLLYRNSNTKITKQHLDFRLQLQKIFPLEPCVYAETEPQTMTM